MSWDDNDFDSDDPIVRYNAHQAAKGRAPLPDPDVARKAEREGLLQRDLGEAWETLPEAPPLVMRREGEADLDITRDGESVEVEGLTDDGTEFIDGYMPAGEYTVVDSGRIILPEAALDALYTAARESGLTWEAS